MSSDKPPSARRHWRLDEYKQNNVISFKHRWKVKVLWIVGGQVAQKKKKIPKENLTRSVFSFFSCNDNVWSVNSHSSLDELFCLLIPSGYEGWTPTSHHPYPTVSYANLHPPASKPQPWLWLKELKVALRINVSFILFDCLYWTDSWHIYKHTTPCHDCASWKSCITGKRLMYSTTGRCRYLWSQTCSGCPHSVPAACFQ